MLISEMIGRQVDLVSEAISRMTLGRELKSIVIVEDRTGIGELIVVGSASEFKVGQNRIFVIGSKTAKREIIIGKGAHAFLQTTWFRGALRT